MRVLISGGCKNGKSFIAQQIAIEQGSHNRYYLATMRPKDNEDIERIKRHKEERKDWGFTTIECPENIVKHTKDLDCSGSFMLDSTTALLANEMFLQNRKINRQAYKKVAHEISKLIMSTENIVVVSDYIVGEYMKDYDDLTLQYCKALSFIDCALAKICDTVMEIQYGNIIYHKRGGK